ncbi:alpha/beta fold hydrolase [Sphingomonas quercus]|uniref:Alpha/beta hydrolase n=1 Tax=Sphingomonas quercus TaxID=2842451 RepID=A0ABS6BGL6_9SPHN|nr:alpha/beta hydrolase [Sphingomonas quercus]MBU3077448.1 alpha/beta hydrolase [Sphingomonas quercus]
MRLPALVLFALSLAAAPALAQAVPDYGADLERYDYPAPVQWFEVPGRDQVRMAYLELLPAKPNGRAIVLLHGKNFCAATWYETARALADAGYRVIAPDQIGFCKSSKPEDFQYSFQALADMTLKLLQARGLTRVTVVGHSMGGQLAARLALMHPERVEQLILVAPLGLNDRLTDGSSYTPLPQLLATEMRTSFESIKAYQLAAYYHGEWRPDYDRWVTMRAGMYQGEGRRRIAIAQARTSDILQTQPVIYELDRLRVPTSFIIGMLDGTGARHEGPPRAVRAAPGSIPALAEEVVPRIPGARLVRMEGLGHSPQVEAPAEFQRTLLQVLSTRGATAR